MRILYVTTVGCTMSFFKAFIRELLEQGHQVDLAAVRCGHGIRQRDFSAVLRFPVLHVRGGGSYPRMLCTVGLPDICLILYPLAPLCR